MYIDIYRENDIDIDISLFISYPATGEREIVKN